MPATRGARNETKTPKGTTQAALTVERTNCRKSKQEWLGWRNVETIGSEAEATNNKASDETMPLLRKNDHTYARKSFAEWDSDNAARSMSAWARKRSDPKKRNHTHTHTHLYVLSLYHPLCLCAGVFDLWPQQRTNLFRILFKCRGLGCSTKRKVHGLHLYFDKKNALTTSHSHSDMKVWRNVKDRQAGRTNTFWRHFCFILATQMKCVYVSVTKGTFEKSCTNMSEWYHLKILSLDHEIHEIYGQSDMFNEHHSSPLARKNVSNIKN